MKNEIQIEQELEPIKKCRVSLTSLEIPERTTIEEWLQIGTQLKKMYKMSKWLIGDWLNYGERKYGEMYTQAMDETGHEYQTLSNYKWICKNVEPPRRRESLSFSHHEAVAKMSSVDQEVWLDKANQEKLDIHEFRRQIRAIGQPKVKECDHVWICEKCHKVK